MRGRRIGYAAWLLLAACLYFFENNTGTRVVLLCTAIVPLIPSLRRAFFRPEDPEGEKGRKQLTIRTFIRQEQGEPGEIRSYMPGDPVQRIHWKLSAKKDELLVRDTASEPETAEEEGRTAVPEDSRRQKTAKRSTALITAGILLCVTMILLIPEANRGAQALCNRLYAASEAVNAYAYRYFRVPEDQGVAAAAVLLISAAVLLLALAAVSRSNLPAMGIVAGCTLFQVYFGLAFPAWINIPLYGLAAVRMMRRPVNRGSAAAFCALLLLSVLLTVILLPGTDAATEAASERARDFLSRMAERITGTVQEIPEGETETRHIHPRTLETGDLEAETEREFRLETVEEELISMPGRIDWMRGILMMALAVALIILPFTPFMVLNARQKRARECRETFGSENVREAVQAIFRQVILWLEATGNGAGNRLYREWKALLPGNLPEGYADRFARCAADYEESVYSDHAMTEEQRRNALDLLRETEKAMRENADRKQRFYLKYWMCLYE